MIISEMQCKLATWSAADKERKFDRLLRLIANPVWLAEAARVTLSSSGAKSPGIDGVNKSTLEPILTTELECIRTQLLSGEYQPAPARRVYIPKAKGKLRPLGIPTLRDRIVQRAMLMAMEPIWESDFHRDSYGFRPQRSVHHAIRAVKVQLTDNTYNKGRWVIEGDLASYFDTVHHRLLMRCVRRRIRDKRFLDLLWRFITAGHVDGGLFRASSNGVPQGGVISPLLSNIMLHEFDAYLEVNYLCLKARNHRYAWNAGVRQGKPAAIRENRQLKPTVSYCRYADDFVVIVKGTKRDAEAIREEYRQFLEGQLKLTLNMEKTHITHVNDGFVFLGHRIIRKRGPTGVMRPVSTIPHEKSRGFAHRLTTQLSGNYHMNKIDMMDSLNRQLAGWANFYQYTDYSARVYQHLDRIVFWKFAHWLARKFRVSIKSLIRRYVKRPDEGLALTWLLYSTSGNGSRRRVALRRLACSRKLSFRWLNPPSNPYQLSDPERKSLTSTHREVAMALSHA